MSSSRPEEQTGVSHDPLVVRVDTSGGANPGGRRGGLVQLAAMLALLLRRLPLLFRMWLLRVRIRDDVGAAATLGENKYLFFVAAVGAGRRFGAAR